MSEANNDQKPFQCLPSALKIVIGEIDRKCQNEPSLRTGIQTGIEEIDKKISGLLGGQLAIVAYNSKIEPNFICKMLENMALKQKIPTAFLYTGKSQYIAGINMLKQISKVNDFALRNGRLYDSDWNKLSGIADSLLDSFLFIETKRMPVCEIRKKIIAHNNRSEQKIKLLVIDELRLVPFDYTSTASHTDNTRLLKGLAEELNIPIIVRVNLEYKHTKKSTKDKKIKRIEKYGEILNDADIAIYILREIVPHKSYFNYTNSYYAKCVKLWCEESSDAYFECEEY